MCLLKLQFLYRYLLHTCSCMLQYADHNTVQDVLCTMNAYKRTSCRWTRRSVRRLSYFCARVVDRTVTVPTSCIRAIVTSSNTEEGSRHRYTGTTTMPRDRRRSGHTGFRGSVYQHCRDSHTLAVSIPRSNH